MVQKNEDISESVNSIEAGAIFPPRSGYDLSRNAFVVSILFPERISLARKVTRIAFLSSRSNTGAGEIEIKQACQKSWQLGRKNEDFSKSVSSFDTGAIFLPSLGQDLSRNRSVVSGYAF